MLEKPRAPVLILGIGNILLQDEGIGVRIIEALRQQTLPPHIELVDGGTAGADLLDILADRQTVLIVDAAQSSEPPGTLLKFSPQDLLPQEQGALSLHELAIPQTLEMARLLGVAPQNVMIFGIVPETIAPGTEPSPTLRQKMPFYVRIILDELQKLA